MSVNCAFSYILHYNLNLPVLFLQTIYFFLISTSLYLQSYFSLLIRNKKSAANVLLLCFDTTLDFFRHVIRENFIVYTQEQN